MTSEWDNTPWAGSAVPKVSDSLPALKAVYGGPYLNSLNSGPLLSSLQVTPQQRAAAHLRAYKVGWFYKAERKISTDIGMLRRAVSPEVDGDNEREVIYPDLRTDFDALDPIGQFLRLMERPNPSYTGRQLFTKTQIRLDMAGWAFWYLENGEGPSGLPTAIYGISPARMWPSHDKAGNLIGWVMDKDAPSGGVPFSVEEILPFTTCTADDEEWYGQGVVEAVHANVPLSELMTRHTADVMTTGGRLAGMLWPKDRSLGADEYEDAKRAWRNVASDPNAARRLLIFPEPMEYETGAANPKDLAIKDLAELDMTTVLSAFPMWPELLGVPMPAGLNASGESRREIKRVYHEESLHPRVELLEDTIQVGLMSRYEKVVGGSWDFDIEEPNLDDAGSLMEKAGAFKALVSIGFDPKEAVDAVGLEGIKWNGLPDLLDPAKQAEAAAAAAAAGGKPQQGGLAVSVNDTSRRDRTETSQPIAKATKAQVEEQRDAAQAEVLPTAVLTLADFLEGQRERLVESITAAFPRTKALRGPWVKADPEWWNAASEDEALTAAMRSLYVQIGRAGLQAVSDTLGRVMTKNMVDPIVTDLLAYGGDRITDINDTTRKAVTREIAEGVRRGYSLNQIIEGVPDEQFGGVKGLSLDNGTAAFSDLRAETIARTETTLGYNRASLTGYGQFGVREFLAYDGDNDAECASRNGAVLAYGEALAVTDHPNGTLVWSPVV